MQGCSTGSRWSTSAPTRRGCWSPTSPAGGSREVERHSRVTRLGRGRRPLRAALRRGDRGRLRGDRRLRRALPRRPAPRRSSRSRPAPCATPPTASAFVAELRERFALSARVLDGEEEARLTYLGATAEQPPDRADPGHRHRRRLDRADRRHRRGDRLPRLAAGRRRPPHRAPHRLRPADRRRAGGAGRRRAGADRGGRSPSAPRRSAERRDRRRRHPDLAGRDRDGARALRPRAGSTATCSPSPRSSACSRGSPRRRWPSAAEIPGLHPDRAPTIVAGVVILIETMRAFGLDRIAVSEHDILYGAAIDSARSSA